MGNGYLYKISRDLRDMSLQNEKHLYQYPSTTEARLIERILVMLSTAAQKLSQKPVRLVGSTDIREASTVRWSPCRRGERCW